MDRLRWAVAVSGMAIVGLVGVGGLGTDSEMFSNEAAEVEARADVNEAGASGAPQQEVVNGWATRDHLQVVEAQLDEVIESGQRERWILVGIVVLLAAGTLRPVHLASSGTEPRRPPVPQMNPAPQAPAPVPPGGGQYRARRDARPGHPGDR